MKVNPEKIKALSFTKVKKLASQKPGRRNE